jgi:hypothetical protein
MAAGKIKGDPSNFIPVSTLNKYVTFECRKATKIEYVLNIDANVDNGITVDPGEDVHVKTSGTEGLFVRTDGDIIYTDTDV